jgi:diguanylate cyclase (GGDEF)-like protein/PAS domain S-box-containing protein
MEQDLRHAVAAGTLEIEYQPEINLRSRRATVCEALLRWRHPVRGEILPVNFIRMAEKIGLIDSIGTYVLERACRDAATWPDDIGVAVNVSPTQIRQATLPGIVAAALQASGLDASRLELEITETVLIGGEATTIDVMRRLRDVGVRLVLDDFGVGYSSLTYLVKFPFDKVKIDRSFVSGSGQARQRHAIVRAIIGLCASLGITCTAEGVETPDQLAMLTHANCTEAQGRLFSPPLAAGDIPAMLGKLTPEAGPYDHARRRVSAADISFFQIAETANDVIIVTTPDLEPPGPSIVYVNPAFSRLTGYDATEAIGLSPRILQGPGTSRTSLDAIRTALRKGQTVREKVLNFAKCGAPYWLDLRIFALRDANGVITHFAAIERDVTMDKRRLDELESIADRDALTGIPNRRAFLRTVAAEMNAVKARNGDSAVGTALCLAFIDVDHFKLVNDEMGHAVGDAVLFGVADRLAENIRRTDVLGRVGGEEFAVCMPSLPLDEARALSERLRHAVTAAPFETPAGPVPISVSIGVAAMKTGDSVARLMRRADTVMYAAKRAGRDRVLAQGLETE